MAFSLNEYRHGDATWQDSRSVKQRREQTVDVVDEKMATQQCYNSLHLGKYSKSYNLLYLSYNGISPSHNICQFQQ